jgi:molybdopterin synthase sulfur carrier subunit
MKIDVRYFASLRETLGPAETLQMPPGSTLGDLRARLREASPRHAEVLGPGRAVRCALDQAMADERAPLHDGAEVAFFPPVTGG